MITIAAFRDLFSACIVAVEVAGCICREAVDVTIIHAEGGGDQDGVMDLAVGGAFVAGFGDVSATRQATGLPTARN